MPFKLRLSSVYWYGHEQIHFDNTKYIQSWLYRHILVTDFAYLLAVRSKTWCSKITSNHTNVEICMIPCNFGTAPRFIYCTVQNCTLETFKYVFSAVWSAGTPIQITHSPNSQLCFCTVKGLKIRCLKSLQMNAPKSSRNWFARS
jgi:hypothetical protein